MSVGNLIKNHHKKTLKVFSTYYINIFFLSGMHYLHAEAPVKVIHRDLKSRNGNAWWLKLDFLNFCTSKHKLSICLLATVYYYIMSHSFWWDSLFSLLQWWWQQTKCWRFVREKLVIYIQFTGAQVILCFLHCSFPLSLISDLWFWGIKVPLPYHPHDSGGHISLDGSWSHSELACVWDLRHLLLWCGEFAVLYPICTARPRIKPHYCTSTEYWTQLNTNS